LLEGGQPKVPASGIIFCAGTHLPQILFLCSLEFSNGPQQDASHESAMAALSHRCMADKSIDFLYAPDLSWSHLMAKIGITQEIEQRPIDILKKQLIKHNCDLRIKIGKTNLIYTCSQVQINR
jgi:hypothetical protein